MILCVDLESGPLPDDQLDRLKPVFVANRTLKDSGKIAIDLADKEAAWRERASLDAKTAQVLVVGTMDEAGNFGTIEGNERDLLKAFWETWAMADKLVGFCVRSFDIPTLAKRSFILGVPVPMDLMDGRYISHKVICLQERFTLFSRDTVGESLDAICKAFGIGEKSGKGADFARLWREDKKAALLYLRQDCRLVLELGKRLGVIPTVPF